MQLPRRRSRTPDHQLDLFLARPFPGPSTAPGWSALPAQARQAVTRLVTCLLIAHAGAGPKPGSDGDER